MIGLIKKLHQPLFYLLILFLPTQLTKHFWPDWATVQGIRIDYLSPTIFLTDLLVVGVLVSWAVDVVLKLKTQKAKLDFRLWELRERKVAPQSGASNSKLLCFLFLFFIFNVLFSQNRPVAFLKVLKLAELFLLAVYVKQALYDIRHPEFISSVSEKQALLISGSQIPKQVRNDAKIAPFNHLTILLSITVIYSALIAWGQFLKQASIGGIFWWLGERTFTASTPGIAQVVLNGRLFLRPYATFSHPNVLAGYLATTLLLMITNYMRINANCELKKRNRKLVFIGNWYLLVFILGLSALFITFSRAAWVVGGVGIVASALLPCLRTLKGEEKKSKKGLGGKNYVLLISLFLCFFVSFLFLGRERLADLKVEAESVKLRQELNRAALLMIKKHPLTGVGLGNFIPALSQFKKGLSYRELQPAHNIFLLIGAETGLVGLGVFLWLTWASYKKLLIINKSTNHLINKLPITNCLLRKAPSERQLLIPLSVILALGLFDHYFFTLQQTQLLLVIVLGMIFGIK